MAKKPGQKRYREVTEDKKKDVETKRQGDIEKARN